MGGELASGCTSNSSEAGKLAYNFALNIGGLPLWELGVPAKRGRRFPNQEKSPMKIALYGPFAAMLLLFSPQLASAQEGHPCKADREKLCPGMKAGDEKLRECMKQHEAELSPECVAGRKERHEAWKNVRTNCKEEFGKFCADSEKGQGGKKCLESHANELGQACADALKAAPDGKKS